VCGKSISISVTVPADTVGGADFLQICLQDTLNNLNCETFNRP
jgi:hypothetical protein